MSEPLMQAGIRRGRPHVGALGIFALALACAAGALVGTLEIRGVPFSTQKVAWPLVFFALLALAVERESIPVTAKTDVSVAFLPLVFVGVVFGPLAAAAVGVATMVPEFPWAHVVFRRPLETDRPYLRWLVWSSSRVLTGAFAGLAAASVLDVHSPLAIVSATVLALVTSFAVDGALTWLTMRMRGTENAKDAMLAVARVAAAGIPIYGAVAALLAYAYLAITPISAALFFIPAVAAHRLFAVSRKQQEGIASLASANERLERANLSFATALVATLDARDRYTAGHSEAVAMYARDIAKEFGWSPKHQQLVDLCGLVHDIGKIGLAPGLLEKPGALTAEERLQMEKHSEIGERILANVEDYAEIALIVRHHHERWDGGGYPDNLAGDEIPLISRVLAVADAYDAMTSHRPYRAALPSAEARRRLRESSGSQFDPDVVEAFEAVLVRAKADYATGRGRTSIEEEKTELVALAS